VLLDEDLEVEVTRAAARGSFGRDLGEAAISGAWCWASGQQCHLAHAGLPTGPDHACSAPYLAVGWLSWCPPPVVVAGVVAPVAEVPLLRLVLNISVSDLVS
jgi:hypothetical protein